MIPECPKGKSASFRAGFKARILGKKLSDCRIIVRNKPLWKGYNEDWITDPRYFASYERYLDWKSGWLTCSRRLGKIRKAERQVEETKQINHEHDMLVELAEELGL